MDYISSSLFRVPLRHFRYYSNVLAPRDQDFFFNYRYQSNKFIIQRLSCNPGLYLTIQRIFQSRGQRFPFGFARNGLDQTSVCFSSIQHLSWLAYSPSHSFSLLHSIILKRSPRGKLQADDSWLGFGAASAYAG